MTAHSREAKRRSGRYGRMFSAFAFGLLIFVAGLLGYDLRLTRSHVTAPVLDQPARLAAAPSRNRWTGAPLPAQMTIGIGLLGLGVFWSRRLNDPRLNVVRPTAPPMKHAGAGRSTGAAMTKRHRLNSSQSPR